MNNFRTLAASGALLLAAAIASPAQAASNDYFIHFGGNDWIQAGDVTVNNWLGTPLAPKPGACGIRLLGSENTQWITPTGFHVGTADASDPILIRLRDLPGCSGSGIDISVDGNAVALPNYDIESFFVYQADNFRWIDNNGDVISPPACGSSCLGPKRFKAAHQSGNWNTAVFVLQNASTSGTRDGGTALPRSTILANLRSLQPALALAELELEVAEAAALRRREVIGADDPSIRSHEDSALAALAEAGTYAQRCEISWSRGSADASAHCERAARLGERARSAVDTVLDLLED
jgi:hypothetical protein